MITLTSQAAIATNGNSGVLTTIGHFESLRGAIFLLNVTSAAAGAGDKLDVFIQSAIDGGTIWDDFVHFTQVLGNGGAIKSRATWVYNITPTAPLAAPQDAALAAGVNQGPVGETWRVKWAITNGGGPLFTFAVSVMPIYARSVYQ